MKFIRFTKTVQHKKKKRVSRITVRPIISDCTGCIWLTDMMLQEGSELTGFVPYTEEHKSKPMPTAPRFYNGIVRSSDTLIIFNPGQTTAGLDIKVYPNQPMEVGSIELSQGMGAHKAKFLAAANAGDEFALLASTRQCLRNGADTPKEGFYQYSAAGDSKHTVKVEKGKSARIYVEFLETRDGGGKL